MSGRCLKLALLSSCLALVAWAQPLLFGPSLRVINIAHDITMDQSSADVLRLLRRRGLAIEEQVDLPPDSLTRLVLAVPPDDTCFPRGEQWQCSNIRIHLYRDGARGHRVMRVESYDRMPPAMSPTVDGVFSWFGSGRGPALDTTNWVERIRGGRLNMWRQRWQDAGQSGVETEIIAAILGDFGQPDDIGSLQDTVIGIGYVHADTSVENLIAAMRRRIPHLTRTP
jgi:hypothetical protein